MIPSAVFRHWTRSVLLQRSVRGIRSRRQPKRAYVATSAEVLDPRIMLSGTTLEDLAAMGIDLLETPVEVTPGVWFLGTGPSPDDLGLTEVHNVNAADSTNADQLQPGGSSGLDLDGSGVTVGVWDGGQIRDTHQELNGKVTLADIPAGLSDHSTHVAGTIAATGVNASAAGMAPGVQLIGYDFNNDKSEIASAAAAGTIDISNHSYGVVAGWSPTNWGFGTEDTWFEDRSLYATEDTTFGKYNNDARTVDQIQYDNPNYLSIWSAGNDGNDQYFNIRGDNTYVAYFSTAPGGGTPGYYRVSTATYAAPGGDGNNGTRYDSLGGDKNAKNSLVIGAVEDVLADPYDPRSVVTTSFSSYGPTDDGRIKPDLVGNGASLLSSTAGSDTSYGIMSGTSMSAPNVTGTTALLIQHYINLYGTQPLATNTKGVLIHNATDVGNFGPDYATGWGLVDAARAASFLTTAATSQTGAFLQDVLYDGTTLTFAFVSDGSGPLKATIVWNDLPGNLHGVGLDITTPVLVNDLDLTILGPGGTTYMPWTLDPFNPNSPAVRSLANTLDNVEQVLIDATIAGVYFVQISASAAITQALSLLVSGFNQTGAGGSIEGTVYNDLDSGGSQNGAEPGIAGRIVYIDANNNGQRDVRNNSAQGSGPIAQPIEDNRTLISTIDVRNVGTSVDDVNVTLRVNHSFTKDLDITLIAPDGTRVPLVSDLGFLGAGYINTTFDDEAPNSIVNGATPYTGSFRPQGNLSTLDGINPNGQWSLEVVDDATGDEGVLHNWSLSIGAGIDEVFTVTDVNGDYQFNAVEAGTYIIRTELPAGWEQTQPIGGAPYIISLGAAENRVNVDFGTSVMPIVLGSQPTQDIYGRASNGRTVVMQSDGTKFLPRYAQADGEWSGVLPVGPHWNELIAGDFNNDGLDDLAGLSSQDGRWRVLIATTGGFLAPQEWGMWSTNVTWSNLMAGDVNGDGLTDIIGRASTGTWVTAVSNGTGFVTKNFGGWSTAVYWLDVQTADLNGDGRTDIIGRASTGTWVGGLSNSGEFVMQVFGAWSTYVSWTTVKTADLNGDGKTDLLGRASSGTWVGALSDGSKFVNYVFGGWSTLVGWSQIHIADFNGDGLDDLVGLSSTGRIVVGTSTGTKFNMSIWTNLATTVSWTTVVGDFDGDGRADIGGRASSGSWYVLLSQGSSFATQRWGGWSTLVDWDNIRSGTFL